MTADRQITAIVPSSRNPERASIRVNGRAVATLSNKHVADLDLRVGQPWTPELADRVAEAAQYDKALRKAMNRLARRAMSRRDLDRKLIDLEFDAPTRQRVLDRLAELGYLDDAAFGKALIRETVLRKPAGPFLLKQKLMQKGLDRTLIDRLVEDATETRDQTADAVDLLRRRLRSMQRLDPAARRRRLYGLLARRGYDIDTISNALSELSEEIGSEPGSVD